MPAQDTTFLTTIFLICRLGEYEDLRNILDFPKIMFSLAPLEIFSKRFLQPAPWKCIMQFLSLFKKFPGLHPWVY
jgi:hypothetical protein